jgi:hypothetical protein
MRGQMFRRLLERLREETHPEAADLFATLMTCPRLRDLVPH